MKQITVEVTQAHIDNGAVADCRHCPIALAFIGAGALRPKIYGCGSVDFTDSEGNKVSTYLPRSARRFLEKFDSEVRVKPFTFRLRYDSH